MPVAEAAALKTCIRCGETKPLCAFNRLSGEERRPDCAECRNKQRRAEYAEDPTSTKQANVRYREVRREAEHLRVKRWREQNPDHYALNADRYREAGRIKAAERRARIRGLPHEKIDPQIVYERDEGICGICGDPVEREEFQVDHIVAIARGGPHLYSNVQASHGTCNRRKGDR